MISSWLQREGGAEEGEFMCWKHGQSHNSGDETSLSLLFSITIITPHHLLSNLTRLYSNLVDVQIVGGLKIVYHHFSR